MKHAALFVWSLVGAAACAAFIAALNAFEDRRPLYRRMTPQQREIAPWLH